MIKRYDINTGYNEFDNYCEYELYEDEQGGFIRYEDYQQEVEIIELEIRYLGEEIETLNDEVKYWKDMYNELYEQQEL